MKRRYCRLNFTPIVFDVEGPMLTGSYTNQAIKVDNVTVDEYDNGFGTDPFKDITFD